ncbi:peroxide stress protein YaaA [Aerococcaceae bacterium NML160702]|nr:peroxide stress protein YaaA [Aerococcaceae bacterium NML160702]
MIAFIGCCKTKKDHACTALEMYQGHIFKKSYMYVKKKYPNAKVYILSAKYGLLKLDEEIEPYELTLNTFRDAEIKNWSKRVYKQLCREEISFDSEAVFLCGVEYYKYLQRLFETTTIPMKGLRMGKRLQWLNKQLEE